MKILADMHHTALWNSLVLLFEKRLGHEIYHPWGLDGWFPDNWKIAKPYGNDVATAKQFLEGGIPNDGTQTLQKTRGVAFEELKHTKFDVFIATYYDHIDVYLDLIAKYQPHAKLIVHYGNEWPIHPRAKNFMCSTAPMDTEIRFTGLNVVYYYQEFSLRDFRRSNIDTPAVASFVNALSINDIFKQDWKDFLEFERLLNQINPKIHCKSFGGGCRDGSLEYPKQIAKEMRKTMFGFHLKNGGDGYGHVVHNWAACGRPIIFRGSQYKNKLAGKLLEHGSTGIDLDVVSKQEAARLVATLCDEGTNRIQYNRMSYNIREKFKSLVDFDKEAQKIHNFLGSLL